MKRKVFSINMSYTSVSTLLWLSYSFTTGYAATFLISNGFSSTLVGTLLSFASILAIFLQTSIGFICDRWPTYNTRFFLAILFFISFVLSFFLYIFSASKSVLGVCFTFLVSIQLSAATLIYTIANEYMNHFKKFHFGSSRAFGSLISAIGMSIIGHFITKSSSHLIPTVLFLLNFLSFFLTLLLFPKIKSHRSSSPRVTVAKPKGYLVFFKTHTKLLLMFTGMLLIYMSATSIYNFQINILNEFGAGNSELGISCAIGCISEVPFMFAFAFLSSRFSSSVLVKAGALFYFIKIGFFCFAQNTSMVYAAQMLQGPSYSLLSMFSVCYINEHTSDNEKAKGQALLGMLSNGMSGIFCNIAAGRMMDAFGVKITIHAFFILAGIGVLLVFSSLQYSSSVIRRKSS